MRRLPRATVALVLAIQSVKLLVAAVLPLFGDEAFYLFEGRHFAAAYDDVPALAPWSLALAQQLLGDALLAVRLPALLLSWATLWLLWRIARDAWDARVAWRVLLLASLPPMLAMNGAMALPDVGINLAVVLCLRALQRAQHGESRAAGAWLAGGLALGCLSHYRFVLPLAAAALWLLLDPAARHLLRERALQRGAVLGLAVGLTPLLWHAWQSEAAGFVFQFHERHNGEFRPQVLFDPLLQALAVGPVLYALLLGEGLRRLRHGEGFARLAAGLGIGLLLLLWLLGPWVDSERSRLHWPIPGYIALMLPLAAAWEGWPRVWRRLTLGIGVVLSLAGAGYLLAAALASAQLAGTRLYPHNFAGWDVMAADVEDALRTLPPGSIVLADHVTLAAQLDRALRGRAVVYSLDHPLNHKHGRAREIARLGRDEFAPAVAAAPARVIAVELSASRLRERAAWLQRICMRYPNARWHGERQIDGGEKRLLVLVDRGASDGICAPGVLGYIGTPEANAVVRAGSTIDGWAVAAGSGVEALRLRIGQRNVTLRGGIVLPSLLDVLGETGDPDFPAVGFSGRLPDDLLPGTHWLWLQARTANRDWYDVVGQPIRVGGSD